MGHQAGMDGSVIGSLVMLETGGTGMFGKSALGRCLLGKQCHWNSFVLLVGTVSWQRLLGNQLLVLCICSLDLPLKIRCRCPHFWGAKELQPNTQQAAYNSSRSSLLHVALNFCCHCHSEP